MMNDQTEFQLNSDYIELNSLMKAIQWVPSGGVAKYCILDGEVKVNSEIESRIRRKCRVGDTIEWRSKKVVIV